MQYIVPMNNSVELAVLVRLEFLIAIGFECKRCSPPDYVHGGGDDEPYETAV